MKTTTFPWTKAAVLTAALAIFPAAARAQGGPPRGHRPPPPSPLVETLDADRDHQISAEEIKGATAALLKLDADGDGKLSKEELRPKPPEGAPKDAGNPPPQPPPPPGPAPAPAPADGKGDKGGKDGGQGGRGNRDERPKPPKNPVMEALDTDGDGELSADEIAKAAESLAKLDKDGDGAISEKEFRPEPPQPQQQGGGRPHDH